MKEFLVKTDSGNYLYAKNASDILQSRVIEIPNGAEVAYFFNGSDLKSFEDDICFYKDDIGSIYYDDNWNKIDGEEVKDFVLSKGSLLWQRQAQPEELPSIDDEQSINDQYAEIEKVRRKTYGFTPDRAARISLKTEEAYLNISDTLKQRESTYGSFEDVASVTQDLLSVLKRTGLEGLPKPHKEALHMICSKMARIVNGDFNHIDGWHDIGGYAKLIENLIGDANETSSED